jgi:cell division protein ZapA
VRSVGHTRDLHGFVRVRTPVRGPVVLFSGMTRSIELKVGGQNVRVVSSAQEEELRGLALVVNRKMAEVAPGGRAQPQALLLVAMSLAHDLEEERARRAALEERTRGLLRRLLGRIDVAVGDAAGDGGDDSE